MGVQVDPDKAFAVQIKHEESVLTGNVAYMQCAVLFSSSNGERRIRCIDLFSFFQEHLSNVKTQFHRPQALLSIDFQCRDDVSEQKQTLGLRRASIHPRLFLTWRMVPQ